MKSEKLVKHECIKQVGEKIVDSVDCGEIENIAEFNNVMIQFIIIIIYK